MFIYIYIYRIYVKSIIFSFEIVKHHPKKHLNCSTTLMLITVEASNTTNSLEPSEDQ